MTAGLFYKFHHFTYFREYPPFYNIHRTQLGMYAMFEVFITLTLAAFSFSYNIRKLPSHNRQCRTITKSHWMPDREKVVTLYMNWIISTVTQLFPASNFPPVHRVRLASCKRATIRAYVRRCFSLLRFIFTFCFTWRCAPNLVRLVNSALHSIRINAVGECKEYNVL